jgi:pimeloyl-ACP methyl ester carboxylesterase
MLVLAVVIVPPAYPASGVNPANVTASTVSPVTSPEIVIGFVGGFVRHDDPHHGPVKLAKKLRETFPASVSIDTFENRHWKNAYRSILRMLDVDHDGELSKDEKKNARIVLFGHSWGASAVVALARGLEQQNIPVLLTVQVDSVAKIGQNDSVIPANVAQAINLYQSSGMIHGRKKIVAADPTRTEILGNYRFDYRKQPVPCPDCPWFSGYFERTHLEIESDPRLWLQVETLIRSQISLAANPREPASDTSPKLSSLK